MTPTRTIIWSIGLAVSAVGAVLIATAGLAAGWLLAAAGVLMTAAAVEMPSRVLGLTPRQRAVAAEAQKRAAFEAQAHLTVADRTWLISHGWKGLS